MNITSTNHMADAFSAFSVTSDDDATQDIADVTTGDGSKRYTSAGSAVNFTISKTFITAFDCKYVAIAGHNFGKSGGTLEIRVNGVLKDTVVFTKGSLDSVILVNFAEVACTTLEVKFIKTTSTDRITITYISLGDLLDEVFAGDSINSEQAGYNRVWRTRSKRSRAVINDAAFPVAYIRQTMSRKVNLTINNINKTVTDSVNWNDFLDRVYNDGDFFIKEESGNPKSSYMCSNAEVAPPKAHPGTRQLNNISIRFNAFTGS